MLIFDKKKLGKWCLEATEYIVRTTNSAKNLEIGLEIWRGN